MKNVMNIKNLDLRMKISLRIYTSVRAKVKEICPRQCRDFRHMCKTFLIFFRFIVLTTSGGIMDHEEARRKHLGGKVLGFFF